VCVCVCVLNSSVYDTKSISQLRLCEKTLMHTFPTTTHTHIHTHIHTHTHTPYTHHTHTPTPHTPAIHHSSWVELSSCGTLSTFTAGVTQHSVDTGSAN